MVDFKNYSSTYALPRAAALQGKLNAPPILLPASAKKKNIYENTCRSPQSRAMVEYSVIHQFIGFGKSTHLRSKSWSEGRTFVLFVTDWTKRSAGPQRGKQRSDSTEELRDHIALDQAEGDYYHTSIWVVRCHIPLSFIVLHACWTYPSCSTRVSQTSL